VPIRDLDEITLPQHPADAGVSPGPDASSANMDSDSEGTHGDGRPSLDSAAGAVIGAGARLQAAGIQVELVNLSTGTRHRLDFFDEAQARRFAAVVRILRRVLGKEHAHISTRTRGQTHACTHTGRYGGTGG
jgi:hypothetical protein